LGLTWGAADGYHTFCLKPKLKEVPEGDWFCTVCQPTPRKAAKRVVDDDDDGDGDGLVEENVAPRGGMRPKRAKRNLVLPPDSAAATAGFDPPP
jgi:hypothetical protein